MRRGIVAILGAAGLVAGAAGPPVQAQLRGVNTALAGVVVVSTSPTDEHSLTAECNYVGQLIAPNQLMVEFTAQAVARGHTAPVSTGVWCEVVNSGGSGSARNAYPGPYAVTGGVVVLPLAPITVCVAATAHFADTHTAERGPECK